MRKLLFIGFVVASALSAQNGLNSGRAYFRLPAGPVPTVAVTVAAGAVSALTVDGASFVYGGHMAPLVNQCTDTAGSCDKTPNSTSTAGNTITQTYDWGSMTNTYVASGNKLTVTTVVSNSAGPNTLLHLWIFNTGFTVPSTILSIPGTSVDSNTDAPSSTFVKWATGTVDAVNEDVTTPIFSGLQCSGLNCQMLEDFEIVKAFGQTPAPRPIAVGATDTYVTSIRFGYANATEAQLAGDIFARMQSTFPQTLPVPIRKPIGNVKDSAKIRPNCATNPRGWNHGSCAIDVTTPSGITAFQSGLLSRGATAVTELQRVGAMGVILWDFEGSGDDNIYIGDPTLIESMAPEMVGVIDSYVGLFTAAGLRVGFTLRPQLFTTYTGTLNITGTDVTWAGGGSDFTNFNAQVVSPVNDVGNDLVIGTAHYSVSGTVSNTEVTTSVAAPSPLTNVAYYYGQHTLPPLGAFQQLDRMVSYCQTRWGADIFYVDSSIIESTGVNTAASVFQQLAAKYPGTLFFPEMKSLKDYAYTIPFQDGNATGGLSLSNPITQVYPGAMQLIYPSDTTLANNQDIIYKRVLQGNPILFDAWYLHSGNTIIKNIYASIP